MPDVGDPGESVRAGIIRNSVKRTRFSRRNRETYDSFTGCKVLGGRLVRLQRIAELLNVDVSDLLRALIDGITSIPFNTEEIGAKPEEINSLSKVNPPSKSDKIRIGVKETQSKGVISREKSLNASKSRRRSA